MKKLNKKGFTITELVIVIAVIAILSAVMIPTFSGMITKSKKSAATQEAQQALTAVLTEEDAQLDTDTYTYYFFSGDYLFKYENNKLVEVSTSNTPGTEAGANDVVYTKDDTKVANLTLSVDDTTTTNVNEATTVTELEDLGNVVVWKKAN